MRRCLSEQRSAVESSKWIALLYTEWHVGTS